MFNRKNRVKDILAMLIPLELPLKEPDKSNWEWVLLELLTNSIRASVEQFVDEQIVVKLFMEDSFFCTEVSDAAKGFNFKNLPYKLSENVGDINVFSEAFEEYREKYSYKRYGLGLYGAKKFADEFDIYMRDIKGNKTLSFDSSDIAGTTVLIKKNINSKEN